MSARRYDLCAKLLQSSRGTALVTESKRFASHKKLLSDYFWQNGSHAKLQSLPNFLLRHSPAKRPEHLYVAVDSDAERIANVIKAKRNDNVPLIEMQPGPGILTEYLQAIDDRTLVLCEDDVDFAAKMLDRPNVELILVDKPITTMAKYYRNPKFIGSFEQRRWDEEIIGQAFVVTSQIDLLNCLCRHVLLQTGFFAKGRIEFFFALPAIDYVKLTCGPDAPYCIYMARSVIFQTLFEHEYLMKFDRRTLLPWYTMPIGRKLSNLKKSIEMDHFYLIRIVPRQNLFTHFNRSDLLALAYFVCQCFSKRTAYIIPKLEQWIDGFGIPLICNKWTSKPPKQMDLTLNASELPKYTRPSMQLTTDDHFTSFHTFTECGELTPEQLISLFHFFKNSPKYAASVFPENAAKHYHHYEELDKHTNKFKRITSKT